MSKENKLKVNMGLKSCDKCEYYLRCEECVGSHYREEMPKLNQRIAELEEQLTEVGKMMPKFRIGQEVWTIRHNNSIYHTRIDEIKVVKIQDKNEIFYYYDQPGSYAHCEVIEEDVFATKEEAQAKLEELKAD